MIIEKIDVKSFGLIKDLTLEFSETVNVIEGENEAGKSTIAAFIRYMLFGFEGLDSDDIVSERKKRINWDTGVAQGSMQVRVKGKSYLITRSTVPVCTASQRESYKEESSIIDLDTGATAFGKMSAGEVFFGVDNDLYSNTAFVGQIGDSAINEGSVKESIENILFSASEALNNQRAAAKVREKMQTLLHNEDRGGVIMDLIAKQQELEGAMERSYEDNMQVLVKETELYRIRSERQEAEAALHKYYDEDNCYRNVMLIQTFDQLHELEEQCTRCSEEYNRFIEENTHSGYVPTEGYLTDIAVARRGVDDAYRVLGDAERAYSKERSAIGITREIEGAIELSDELGGEDRILSDAKSYHGGFVKNLLFGILSSLGVIAAVVYEIVAKGALTDALFRILVGAAGVAALSGAVTFILLMFKDKKCLNNLASRFGVAGYGNLVGKISVIAEARAKRDGMIHSTENARLALDKARVDYDNAKSELTRVIVRWGGEPPVGSAGDYLDKLEARVTAFLEKKRIKLEEKSTTELMVREIRRTLADKNEIDIRGQVPPLKRKSMAAINHDDIITGIAANKAKIAEQDRLAFAVENELMALKSRSGDPGEYYVRIKGLEERIEELKKKHKAYYVALKTIEGASENLRAGISPRLGEYATGLMSIMTDKKYSDFDVSDGLKVTYTTENGEKKSVDFLSGGTRDLAYIAVRMALMDMLYSEKPPMCFDESFAHQDNNRARAMMKALCHLAGEGYQSFVFTCRGREAVLAKELIESAGVYKLSLSEA